MIKELQSTQVLDDRFQIVEVISRSGMACLYKATDLRTGQTVAVKIPLECETDAASFSRFQREQEIGCTLDHPYILKFVPVEEPKSRPYIVTEYLYGQTLAELLAHVRPLPEPDAVKIASRLCDALGHMHRHNVIHRDLKPANIMLCDDGSIRIMDFGIARAARMRRITFVGFSPAMGTPDYMAPEQVKGKRGDERTDIYSLGALLYEMATGSVPYPMEGGLPYVIMNVRLNGDPAAPRSVNPKLTPVLEEVILHALERDPSNRFASAAAMKAELDDFEIVPLTGRHKRLQPARAWKTPYGQLLPAVLTFLVAQILILLLLYWYFAIHKHAQNSKAVSAAFRCCQRV
jgi:serine/threonine protein kinase